VLAVLEGYATAEAAPLITAGDLAALQQRTDDMVTAMEGMDSLTFGRHNRAFHQVIYDRCPNPTLVAMLRDVDRRLDAIRTTVFVHIPYRGASSVAEHRELIALLRGGASAKRIETTARQHKLRTVESFRAWQRAHGNASHG
jgi:DNA-binding GntR family transcriptional regulator